MNAAACSPATPPASDDDAARGWRWPAALLGQFVFVFSAVALSGPGRIDIVDGQTRYEVARSLVVYGDSVIRDQNVWFRVHDGRDGDKYTPYRFPQSGLGVLAIHAADATGEVSELRRQFFFSLIGAACAALLSLTYTFWFRGLGHSLPSSLGWGTLGIFCTPSWYYGTSTFDDILGAQAVVLAVAAAFLCRNARPWTGALIAALSLAWAVNCKEPLALFALPVLAALYRPNMTLRRQLGPLAVVAAGALVGLVAYKIYDLWKFPPGSADHNAEYAELFGAMWTANPLPGLLGLAVSPSSGVLWYWPPVILALVGWFSWRQRWRLYCDALAAAAALFVVFLSFLTFFKGEPCWGPRYLTPVFALAWVFVPSAVGKLRHGLLVALLVLGAGVQLLGLSLDPQRLLLDRVIPFNYYVTAPWLQFNPQTSHLFQRPREIADVVRRSGQRAPEFCPGPTPTASTMIAPAFPVAFTAALGQASSPLAPGSLSLVAALPLGNAAHTERTYQDAVRRYHVFASFRPWWHSHRHLTPGERPVDWGTTLLLLLGGAGLGLGAMLAAGRARGMKQRAAELIPVADRLPAGINPAAH